MSARRATVRPSPSPLSVATIPFSATPVSMSRGRPVYRREHLFCGPLRTEAQFGLAVNISAEGDDLLTEVLFDLCL